MGKNQYLDNYARVASSNAKVIAISINSRLGTYNQNARNAVDRHTHIYANSLKNPRETLARIACSSLQFNLFMGMPSSSSTLTDFQPADTSPTPRM